MERLLFLRVDACGCEAEVLLNDIPLVRLPARPAAAEGPARPLQACVPVHEYTLAGLNRLSVVLYPRPLSEVVWSAGDPAAPPPTPRLADGHSWIKVRLLLPRMGQPASDTSARTLGQLDWALAENTRYDTPLTLQQQVELPVAFPRWRWLDAPVIDLTPALRMQVLAFVQQLAMDLAQGNPESFLAATRLRFEELALAYQRPAADDVQRFRAHLQQLASTKSLRMQTPEADSLLLRRIADGRLLECLTPDGQPLLRTQTSETGSQHAWPLRLAVVEGRFYALR